MLQATSPNIELRSDDAPAVRVVDELIDAAMRAKASDIHIEPTEGDGRARHRVDGILVETRRIPHAVSQVCQVKLLAAMDIAEKRAPQDGRYHIELHGRSVDARISRCRRSWALVVQLLDLHADVPASKPHYECRDVESIS